MRKNPAYRVGVPPFRASRMEQKIVEVPKSQVVIALGQPGCLPLALSVFRSDLAIRQQGENLDPRKTVLLPELSDLLRGRQRGERGSRASDRRS